MTAVKPERSDFRIRRTGGNYAVWQRIGSGWERLADRYPTKQAAQAAIKGWLR